MSAQQGSASTKEDVVEGKGKGKSAAEPQESGMDVDDSSSEEEVDEEAPTIDEPDEDNMEEIDLDNIIGRRTRGVTIDYAKAAEELPEDDDEDEDDGDFEAPNEDEEMKD